MFKFVPTSYKNYLNEIKQNLETRFAFVKKYNKTTYTNAHDFVRCRDFLGDALVALRTKTKQAIYGFSFDGKKQSFITSQFMLLVRCPNQETLDNTLKNLYRLHEIESTIGKIKKTEIKQIEDVDNKYTVLVTGSKFWYSSVFNVSLYTFLVKSLGYELDPEEKDFMLAISNTTYLRKNWDGTETERPTVEAEYATAVGVKVMRVLPKLRNVNRNLTTLHGYKKGSPVTTIHDSSGFKSLFTDTTIQWKGANEIHSRLKEVLNAM